MRPFPLFFAMLAQLAPWRLVRTHMVEPQQTRSVVQMTACK